MEKLSTFVEAIAACGAQADVPNLAPLSAALYMLSMKPKAEWMMVDFNGILEPGLLCLSHTDYVNTAQDRIISLQKGMVPTANDDDGNPDNIFASGVVEKSPSYA